MKRLDTNTPPLGVELGEEALASVSGGFTDEFPCGNDILFRLKGFPGPRPPVLNIGGLATLNTLAR